MDILSLTGCDRHGLRAAAGALGARCGEISGVPVVTSGSLPSDGNSPTDNLIVAVDAAEVFMHEGGIEVDASEQATIELSSTPDSPATSSTVLTSLWQNNLTALKIVRYMRWKAARGGAAAYLRGVPY